MPRLLNVLVIAFLLLNGHDICMFLNWKKLDNGHQAFMSILVLAHFIEKESFSRDARGMKKVMMVMKSVTKIVSLAPILLLQQNNPTSRTGWVFQTEKFKALWVCTVWFTFLLQKGVPKILSQNRKVEENTVQVYNSCTVYSVVLHRLSYASS